MDTMEGLPFVIKQLPGRAQAIRKLALIDETFRSLCADIGVAETALRRFERLSPKNTELHREYEVLVFELLSEVVEALDVHENQLAQSQDGASDG